jgi:hypothetical protein
VKTADVGNPTTNSLLEEVGAYAFVTVLPQARENNVTAQKDIVPLQIDGVCCYNFKGGNPSRPPRKKGGGGGGGGFTG